MNTVTWIEPDEHLTDVRWPMDAEPREYPADLVDQTRKALATAAWQKANPGVAFKDGVIPEGLKIGDVVFVGDVICQVLVDRAGVPGVVPLPPGWNER